MNLAVIGTGYVGLTVGLGFAKLGHQVACVDTDAAKVAKLEAGEPTFFEPGVKDLMEEMRAAGRVSFTANLSLALKNVDVVLLCVGTPPKATGEADLSFLMSAATSIGDALDHDAVVAVKSTVPVGTVRRIKELIPRGSLAMLPEFLREGQALADFFKPDRIVIGSDDMFAFDQLTRLHEGIDAPILRMSIESAELSKLASNAFLATKISFINEIAAVCEMTGADVRDVSRAVGADARIGKAFLSAGIGYGGSCFPKDVSALHHLAGSAGYDFQLLASVIEVNTRMRGRFVQTVEASLGSLAGRMIAVWGLTFKPGTDDIRESAAIDIVRLLLARGAAVTAFDPQGMEQAARVLPSVKFAGSAMEVARGADALLVLTEWPEFHDIDFDALKAAMKEPRIFDGRNTLADLDLATKGFDYKGVGIPV